MPTIDETIAFIKRAHAGQLDKAGNPYWLHPVSVMGRLGSDAPEVAKLVALLHDIIEDTDISAVDLRSMGYADDVVIAVQLLSRPTELTYMAWIDTLARSENKIAIQVKIADNEDNLDPDRIAALPPERRGLARRYKQSLQILRAV